MPLSPGYTCQAQPDSTRRLKPDQLPTQPAGGEAQHTCSPLDNSVWLALYKMSGRSHRRVVGAQLPSGRADSRAHFKRPHLHHSSWEHL